MCSNEFCLRFDFEFENCSWSSRFGADWCEGSLISIAHRHLQLFTHSVFRLSGASISVFTRIIMVLLLCKFRVSTAIFCASSTSRFRDVIEFACGNWDSLNSETISFTYELPGNALCMLRSDYDLNTLISFACSVGLEHVNVSVYDGPFIPQIEDDASSQENHMMIDSSSGHQDGVDMLSKYCHHEPKILLTASWAQAIRDVGQPFEGGVGQFRRALKMYSMEVGFEYDFVKNTKERVIATCRRRATNNCMWRVNATLQKINGYFYIRSLNNIHTCGAAIRTTKNSRMSSELVASLIRDKVRDKPLTRPTDIVYDFKESYGLDITYHHAWWGVDRAKNELFGHQSLLYDLLRWYKEETERTNPGSIIEIDYDINTGRFKRVFVSFYACIYGFWYCRPMLFLDGTFLKGRYKGNLLAATAKDGDQGNPTRTHHY
ncbi:hypothetical protein L1049_012309 [Liquidambar formosana]|uniref:Transposase MuDR plant domain-containing protein n=1 Tax=Liquidambar formosana TaxID=63359 RepID=A0AAP0WXK6_LIQFO